MGQKDTLARRDEVVDFFGPGPTARQAAENL
jgi:NTE family protein